MLSEILTMQCGAYQIIQARDGEEAYTKAISEKPDLVLMDVMMPGIDGYEALAKFKGNPATEPIKVMILSAFDRPVDRRLALELGAWGYMTKPVRIDELLYQVNWALDRRHKKAAIPCV